MKKVLEKLQWISPSFSFTEVRTQAERGSAQRHRASRRQQPQARGLHEPDFQRQPLISACALMLCADSVTHHGLIIRV